MKTRIIILLLIFIGINSHAQKRPMTIDDLKTWNRMNNTSISSNGEYVSYRIVPNKGDANLFLYHANTKETKKFERGKKAQLGFNNNLLVFKISPQTDSLRQKK